MRKRTRRRKRQRAANAVRRGDEVPDPATIVAVALATSAATGLATGVTSIVRGFNKPKAPTIASPLKSPIAGQPTGLTHGQKTNAINTSPQGLLETASTARSTLLGN